MRERVATRDPRFGRFISPGWWGGWLIRFRLPYAGCSVIHAYRQSVPQGIRDALTRVANNTHCRYR
mgnify:CR=1 FL=1